MSDPLEFLQATHARAEQAARAAADDTAPEWSDGGEYGDEVHTKERGVSVAVGAYTGYLTDGVREHIALHDPAAVLRRITAERKMLAEHQVTKVLGWAADWVDSCAVCSPHRVPCATVRALAEAWGWTEEGATFAHFTSEQARAVAADLIAHADELDRGRPASFAEALERYNRETEAIQRCTEAHRIGTDGDLIDPDRGSRDLRRQL